MSQAIEVETQSKQQGLTHRSGQRAARGTSREFAFDRRKQALDQSATPIESSRKRSSHLRSHSVDAPRFLSAFGRDHALRTELLSDILVIPLAVELGVGQHQADGRSFGSRFHDSGQIRAIVPRTASRDLRQHELLIQIHDDHPLQPCFHGSGFCP